MTIHPTLYLTCFNFNILHAKILSSHIFPVSQGHNSQKNKDNIQIDYALHFFVGLSFFIRKIR